MRQYIVDAFTREPFAGNPAAVCVMDDWPSEAWMMKLAMENNLSETAFVVREGDRYRLRWFTPGTEVELCGHATLASAFVVLNECAPRADQVRFETLSGTLTVTRSGGLYRMDFPTYALQEIPVTDDMARAFGVRPAKAVLGLDLVCVFDDERAVRDMAPDRDMLMRLPGRIQNATARGSDADCVSRSFCPKLAVYEDPVCGSAHCQIAAYWADALGRTRIHACQASKRGGHLYCEMLGGGRIAISGEAVLVAVSEIVAKEA
ncbi:MAG: PhzF family phenazine biosynthesis protein [Clostridiales bacterium]|nr:PhzF family phenazine biosynthesis protein [Clostridiales bacterium]